MNLKIANHTLTSFVNFIRMFSLSSCRFNALDTSAHQHHNLQREYKKQAISKQALTNKKNLSNRLHSWKQVIYYRSVLKEENRQPRFRLLKVGGDLQLQPPTPHPAEHCRHSLCFGGGEDSHM